MILKKRLIFFVMAFVVSLSSLALLFTPSNYKTVSADSLEDRYNLVVYPNNTLNNLGVTISNDGQYLYINGVKNTASLGYLNFDFPINAGTYTFSINTVPNLSYFFIVDGVRYNYNSVPITFTITNNSTFNLNFVTAIAGSYNDIQIKPMLNIGSIAYPFIVPLASNPSYYLGLQNGYNQGYQDSLKENSFPNINNSQGVFEYADISFTYYNYDNLPFDNNLLSISSYLSNFSNVPLQYNLRDITTIIGYNNGFTALDLNSDLSSFAIDDFITTSGEPFDDYSHYRILFNSAVKFNSNLTLLLYRGGVYSYYNVLDYRNRVDMPILYAYYSDGSSSLLSTNDFQSYVGLDLSKSVLALDIIYRSTERVIPTIIPSFTDMDVSQAYNNGYHDGNKIGYENGYTQGSHFGYDKGYRDGLSLAEDSDLVTFISAVVGAPVTVVSKFLNFEILGVNIFGFVSGFLTLMLIIKVLSLFIGGKLR